VALSWLEDPRTRRDSNAALDKATLALAGGKRVVAVYEHYFAAESTVPGAGMGVFAKRDLPKGEGP
jgi:hypothetical protein